MKFIDLVCVKCFQPFQRRLKIHNRNIRLGYKDAICSATCRVEHNRIKPCLYCGEPTNNPKYCSVRCRAFVTSKMPRKPRKKLGSCKGCGMEISSSRAYCPDCKRTWETRDWTGVTLGHLRKQREINGDATTWRLARRIYIASDKPKHCIACGYSKHFDVCHVKDVAGFPDETPILEVNDLSNLIALCKNHHWEFDNDLLDDTHRIAIESMVDPARVELATGLL